MHCTFGRQEPSVRTAERARGHLTFSVTNIMEMRTGGIERNSCTDQWAALFEPFHFLESCLVRIWYGMFISNDGRVLTRKLAQLIRQKSLFSFAFSGCLIKLWSNRKRFYYFLASLDEFQSYKPGKSNTSSWHNFCHRWEKICVYYVKQRKTRFSKKILKIVFK